MYCKKKKKEVFPFLITLNSLSKSVTVKKVTYPNLIIGFMMMNILVL